MVDGSIGDNTGLPRSDRRDRAELVRLVERIMSAEGTEEELDAWLRMLDRQGPTPDGHATGLIYHPEDHGLGPDPGPAEIVERLLSYRPIAL
ncbi:e9imm peptide [Plantactinospora endophytica]|uniref:E9imm peptide n=1 Tax=Plantactinospora endophytica TaxID=673535 RepID=A0ABQ4E678_9ACTN|nr:e9imm peptide [Plantactinospora endophytica]GIG89836.1 hypothetical protein Pen02_47720 [Plantactinospora endophytica]